LIPYYRHAQFGPGFWAAAFSYATVAALALRWINHEDPPAAPVWRGLTLTLASAVVVLLTGASASAARRRQFFPRLPAARPAHSSAPF
jgi:tellurite resistance protein